jgi:Icc-related predicted phosphoesterase
MRIFFATDLHGSTLCFRKFLAAKAFYDCDTLVLGGDITGKAIVPIRTNDKKGMYTLYGKPFEFDFPDGLKIASERIRNVGFYPLTVPADEPHEVTLRGLPDKLNDLVRDHVLTWAAMAAKQNAIIYMIPGNDDISQVDKALEGSTTLINIDRQTIEIGEGWSLSGLGGSNETPWETAREYSEEKLENDLEQISRSIPNWKKSLFNIHVPPFASGLDLADAIDERFRVIRRLGQSEPRPVGSRAVARFLREWQPPLSLHGHIHDCRGWKNLGRTLCINPGSEYFVGILNGCVVEIGGKEIKNFQLTRG